MVLASAGVADDDIVVFGATDGDAVALDAVERFGSLFADGQIRHGRIIPDAWDGREFARYSEWNAPVTTPVAPPESEVVDIPGL